jgi:2'-5' RNA ligase
MKKDHGVKKAIGPTLLDSGLDVTTALCLVVDVKADAVNAVRVKHDKACARWPPHINFVFPFVPFSQFPAVGDAIALAIASFGEFELVLDNVSHFSQGKGKCTFNLQPTDDSKLQKLFALVEKACPPVVADKKRKPFHPHLTLGQCEKKDLESMLSAVRKEVGTVSMRVTHLSMIARFEDKPFEVIKTLPL